MATLYCGGTCHDGIHRHQVALAALDQPRQRLDARRLDHLGRLLQLLEFGLLCLELIAQAFTYLGQVRELRGRVRGLDGFDLAFGDLRSRRPAQPVFDTQLLAQLVELMVAAGLALPAGKQAIRELLAVVNAQ